MRWVSEGWGRVVVKREGVEETRRREWSARRAAVRVSDMVRTEVQQEERLFEL